ncbi:hypothetical protein IH781_03045 [Patescibacteria group bacterium]|nr:hypothetical protein [Patescibacteria group bacterium]
MPRNQFWFVWILLVLAGVVLAATLVTSTKTRLDYQAIVVEGTAALPTDDQQLRRHLHDGDELTQWFVAPTRRLVRIGLGASDPRLNPPAALLIVDLVSEAGDVIASTSTSVSQLREDDITLLPLVATIKPGSRYGLLIRTTGVSESQPIDIYYDSDELAPPDTLIEYRAAETPERVEQLPGALRWQVIQDFTSRGVVDAFWHSPLAAIVLAYWLLLAVVLIPAVRGRLTKVLNERLDVLGSHKISWRQWLGVWLLGFGLALMVTWPFYTQLQQFDTQGDVNRALIFRGIGRVSYLAEGEIARWDHYSCGGWPLLANIESAHLDPFFPLVLLFGEQLGLRLTVTVILAIGFVGAWALARRLGQADPITSLLAGAIFSYSGFQMLAFSYGVFAWLPVGLIPWMLYFLLKSQQRTWQVVWAALLLAAIFLGGGPHMPVFAALTALLLMIGLAIAYRSWRPLVLLLLVLLLTSSLTAVKLIPAVELTGLFDSFRREATFLAPLSWAPKMFWDRGQLTTDPWVFPPTGEVSRWTEFGSYVGIIPVLLLVVLLD